MIDILNVVRGLLVRMTVTTRAGHPDAMLPCSLLRRTAYTPLGAPGSRR